MVCSKKIKKPHALLSFVSSSDIIKDRAQSMEVRANIFFNELIDEKRQFYFVMRLKLSSIDFFVRRLFWDHCIIIPLPFFLIKIVKQKKKEFTQTLAYPYNSFCKSDHYYRFL